MCVPHGVEHVYLCMTTETYFVLNTEANNLAILRYVTFVRIYDNSEFKKKKKTFFYWV